jgi:hypothetical protein
MLSEARGDFGFVLSWRSVKFAAPQPDFCQRLDCKLLLLEGFHGLAPACLLSRYWLELLFGIFSLPGIVLIVVSQIRGIESQTIESQVVEK